MPAQSTMEGFAKMMALGAVVKGGVGGINKTLAKVGMGSKEAKTEAMYERRQKRLKKEKRDEIFDEEVMLAEKHARANGSMLQAIKDGYAGRERINDIEQAHAEALREYHQKEIEEGDAITSQDYAGRKKANADRFAGNKTEQEWFWGNQKRQEALDRKRDSDETKAYGHVLTEIEREANYKKERNDAIKKQGSPTKIEDEDEESEGASSAGGGAGFGGGEILAAILETNQILSQTFEAMRDAEPAGDIVESKPGSLMSGEEIFDRDHPDVEAEQVVEGPNIAEVQKVSMESMLDGEPLPMHADQLEELLEIEREELDFDRRREAREIKADRRALEDRRDSKFSKLKRGFGRKGKKPNKKKGGGLFDMLWKFGARWLMPIAGLTGGWLGMKSILGLSTKGDDAARLAKALKAAGMNADDAARLAQLKNADDAARALQHTDDLGKTTTKVVKNADALTDITKSGAKTTKVFKVGEDVLGNASKIGKVADGIPSTNLGTVTGKVDDAGKAIKTVSTKMDKFGNMLKNLPKTIKSLVKGTTVAGQGLGGATTLANVTDAAMDAPDLLKTAEKTTSVKPGMHPNSKLHRFQKIPPVEGGPPSMIKKGVAAGADTLKTIVNNPIVDKLPGVKALKLGASATTQTLSATGKMVGTVISKLATGASRVAKVLAPLDIYAKMDQGQGLFESMGNMVIEVGNLALGAGELATEQFQDIAKYSAGIDLGEGGFSDKSAGDIAFKTADIFGNEEKWDTHAIEKTINFGMAKWYGTEQVANKKTYTEEQEALALNAENELDIVDVGTGLGDIEDLEKLSLLDEKTLEALLAYQVWDDEDQKLIEDLVEAKKAGVKITYDDGGVFGGEFIKYGEAVEGQTAEQKAYQATLTPDDAASGMTEYVPQEGDEGYKDHLKPDNMFSGMWDKFASLFENTPDVASADKMAETTTLMAEEATKKGSIFTHDTHLEKTLWDIWGEEKTFLSTPAENTTVGIAGEKDGGDFFDWFAGGESTDFAPQKNMFGNQQDLIAPVPVIDVSPNAPIWKSTEEGTMSSELLAQVVSQISIMEKQATVVSSGSNTNVNSVSNTDQSVINQIAAPATAHGPITPGTNR